MTGVLQNPRRSGSASYNMLTLKRKETKTERHTDTQTETERHTSSNNRDVTTMDTQNNSARISIRHTRRTPGATRSPCQNAIKRDKDRQCKRKRHCGLTAYNRSYGQTGTRSINQTKPDICSINAMCAIRMDIAQHMPGTQRQSRYTCDGGTASKKEPHQCRATRHRMRC